jgi:hypothetical protein
VRDVCWYESIFNIPGLILSNTRFFDPRFCHQKAVDLARFLAYPVLTPSGYLGNKFSRRRRTDSDRSRSAGSDLTPALVSANLYPK